MRGRRRRRPGLASLVPAMKIAPPAMDKAEAVRAFNDHADGTNDIFHLAAQLIAGVLLRADQIIQGTSDLRHAVMDLHSLALCAAEEPYGGLSRHGQSLQWPVMGLTEPQSAVMDRNVRFINVC